MSKSGTNLREIFSSARAKQSDLENLEFSSETYQETLQSAILAFEQCRKLVAELAIFSPNEELEDIPTANIQFLAVDYLLAELLLKSYGSDRRTTLQQSLDLFESFLSRLDSYESLSREDRKLFDRFLESRAIFSIASSENATERRRIKVARFQEEKALKTKLEYLRRDSNTHHSDDDTVRELYLAEIQLFSNRSFQSLDVITQENAILNLARDAPPEIAVRRPGDRQNNQLGSDDYSDKLDLNAGPGRRGGPLLSKSGKPLRPFTLTDKRTQLRQGVFKPGHNLPTMSIDEYLEEERRRGGILDGNEGNPNSVQDIDEDNEALVDAETMKARAWDEFTEANPKGSGNTLNRG